MKDELQGVMRRLTMGDGSVPPELIMTQAIVRLERLTRCINVGGHYHVPHQRGAMRGNFVTDAEIAMNYLYHIERAIYDGRFK